MVSALQVKLKYDFDNSKARCVCCLNTQDDLLLTQLKMRLECSGGQCQMQPIPNPTLPNRFTVHRNAAAVFVSSVFLALYTGLLNTQPNLMFSGLPSEVNTPPHEQV